MSDFTPSTNEARMAYREGVAVIVGEHLEDPSPEFDRWLAQVREEAYRKGVERGYIGAKVEVESIGVGEPFDIHTVIHRIKSAQARHLGRKDSLSSPYFD